MRNQTALSSQHFSLFQQEEWKASKRGSRTDKQQEVWEFLTRFTLGLPGRDHHSLETLQRERSSASEDKDFKFIKGDAWEVSSWTASLCPQEKSHSPASFKEKGFSFSFFSHIIDHPKTKLTERKMWKINKEAKVLSRMCRLWRGRESK